MMNCLTSSLRLFGLMAALLAMTSAKLSAQAFVGSDNFDSGSNAAWGFSYRLSGTNGTLNFTNQRLEFTSATNGTGNYFLGWDGDTTTPGASPFRTSASYTSSWVANITVADTFVTGASEFASIGLQVRDGGSNYSALMLQNVAGSYLVRAEGTGATFANTSATGSNTNVSLRLAWDAGTHVLSSYYSFDSGASYSLLKTFTPDSQWSAAPSGGFNFELFGNASGATAISAGSMYADNFSVSAVPEPSTYAAIAGASMLGIAIWKRRRRSSVG